MRTWTLRTGEAGQVLASPPSLGPGLSLTDQAVHPGVEVIELEAVLDLLEEAGNALREIKHWSGAGPHPIATPFAERIDPLLRAHGRLDG